VGHPYPGKITLSLARVYQLIQASPGTRFVLAHLGGGLLFYELMKKEVREVLKNTWYDTAAAPFLYDPLLYSVALMIGLEEKILFGTDFPLLKTERYLKEFQESGIGRAAMEKILGGNAKKVLNR
jgi:predicted TIM-barrel fold metal-dependent hydrolase